MGKIMIDNTINLIQECVCLLYQENVGPAYKVLAALFPKIEEIILEVDEESQKMIKEKLQMVLGVMEQQDSILLADALQYELLDGLKMIKEQ